MTVALVVGVALIVLGLMLHAHDAGPRQTPTPRVRPNPNWADEEMLALWLRDNGGIG